MEFRPCPACVRTRGSSDWEARRSNAGLRGFPRLRQLVAVSLMASAACMPALLHDQHARVPQIPAAFSQPCHALSWPGHAGVGGAGGGRRGAQGLHHSEAGGGSGQGGDSKGSESPLMYRKLVAKALPLLWPEGWGLRTRMMLCFLVLILSRICNMLVPLCYKGAVDTLLQAPPPPPVADTTPVRDVWAWFNVLAAPSGAAAAEHAGADPVRGNQGGVDARWRRLLQYVLCYVCIKGYVGVQADVRNMIFTPVSQSIRRRIQLAVFDHLHALSHNYHINRKTGAVLHVVDRGSSSLQTVLSLVAFNVLPALFDMLLCGGVFIYSGHRALAAVTAATMLVYLSITAVITDWRTKFRKETLVLEAKSKQRAIESITHYEAVKLFGGAPKEARLYGAALDDCHTAEMRVEVSLLVLNVAQQAVMGVGLFACMTNAARQVMRGKMSVGDLVLVNTYLLQLYQPLNWIGSIYRMIQQNFVEMEQLFSLLEEPVDIKDAPNATDLDALPYSRADSPLDAQPPPHAGLPSAGASTLNASALSGGPLVQADKCNREAGATARAWDDAVGGQWSIEFDNVYFSYDARREVLSNFSLTMRPGETVALVGPSGSGKSTVARLLCRLYDPTSGRVLIAGRDLRHVTLSSVRRTVGVIPQDAALFQNTIEYNIAYAKPGDGAVPRTEVEEAAQGAQMHTGILAFPDGYQSQVGERGLRLSGGERQRLSLARVLLKQAPVVVLDEATSALDSRTEAQVQVALQRACAGRTTLVIAHRLSTISHADRILVLVNGSVAEAGSHQELLKRNGHYADMWKLQQPTP